MTESSCFDKCEESPALCVCVCVLKALHESRCIIYVHNKLVDKELFHRTPGLIRSTGHHHVGTCNIPGLSSLMETQRFISKGQRKQRDNKQVKQKLSTCTPWPQRPTFISQFVVCFTGTQTTCWKPNWDLLLFAGLPHSSRESFSVWTQRGLSHILVLVWTSRDRCVIRVNVQPASRFIIWNLLGSNAVWVHSSVSAKLVVVYWPVRPVDSRSSLDGGAKDNPVSDWLQNPGVAPGKWLTFMGLTVAALLSLNASLCLLHK